VGRGRFFGGNLGRVTKKIEKHCSREFNLPSVICILIYGTSIGQHLVLLQLEVEHCILSNTVGNSTNNCLKTFPTVVSHTANVVLYSKYSTLGFKYLIYQQNNYNLISYNPVYK